MSLVRKIRHKGRVYLNAAIHFLFIHRYLRRARRNQPNARFTAVTLIEHLGDIVACEPVARYLREKDPATRIIWLVKREYRELVSSNPFVDLVVVVHCLTEKDYLTTWCSFDQVIDLHFLERYCALCGEAIARKESLKKSDSDITLQNFYTYGGILQSMSRFAGLPPLNETPRVYLDEKVKLTVDALLLPKRFVVFHCSSNTAEKELPGGKWSQLTHFVTKKYEHCVVEVGLDPVLHDVGNMLYRDLTGRLTILETAEVIRRAALFVGIDSGPAHLANAVGTYGIILLGSYLGFKRYNPFSGNYSTGSNASLVYADGPVANISVDRVQQSVDAALGRMSPKQ